MENAVARAVEEGIRELDSLDLTAASLSAEFERVTGSALADGTGSEVDAAEANAHEFGDALREHVAKQRDALGTFNIAFFGRTGAGKSTLLSAFGRLDGGYVSPGESDWTTDVSEIAWNGCRLWDTPGINGWGRTRTRADLEETARRAVEVADMVMLCFDTQSQQSSEFAKIAEWVREFGKPAIAVVNVRNLRWRHPAKVASDMARRSLSQSVREHVDNIQTELNTIGLPATPVVAINSRRALFARAATPFMGQSESNFMAEREKFGVDYLARWSNFSTLEDLVTASILMGGSELRRRALREGVRGMLTAKAAELESELRETAPRIDAAERRIEELLDVLGYPEDETQEAALGAHRDKASVLTVLESFRGKPFTSPTVGRLDRYVKHVLRSHLAPLRADAVTNSDKLIAGAFDKRMNLDEAGFNDAVYRIDAIQAAVDDVWSAKADFLSRELSLSALDSAPVLSDAELESTTLKGAAGRVKSFVARGVRAAGLAAGAGSGALTVPAVVNLWNPVGWGATAAAITLGVASQAGKYAGGKVAKLSEKERATVRAESIRSSRRAVHSTFDRMEEDLLRKSRQSTWEFLGPELSRLLLSVLTLRRHGIALEQLAAELRGVASGLPATPNAEVTMTKARAAVLGARAEAQSPDAERDVMTEAFGREVWLGEDWVEDSNTEVDVDESILHAVFETRASSGREQLHRFVSRAWDPHVLDHITGLTYMAHTALAPQGTSGVPNIGDSDSPPKVVFLGDYSSGKSSLIKRILVESGHPIPDTIRVHGGAATTDVDEYYVGNVRLVDTPGFQSNSPEHRESALHTVAGAALVIVVLHVNLLIGDSTLIQSIAHGTDELVSKSNRTLYVINRSDELGIDPGTAPEEFLALKDRKESELIAALASRGIAVDHPQVYSVSGDPFGKVGSRTNITASAYTQHRAWDGIEPLVSAIVGIDPRHAHAGAARATLDVALTRMLERRADLEGVVEQANALSEADRALLHAVENSVQDAALLTTSLREEIRSTIDSYATIARAQVRAADSQDFHTITAVANSWWKDAAVQVDIERFGVHSAQVIAEWFQDHSSQIDREIAATEFAEREFSIDDRFDGPDAAGVAGAKLFAGAAQGGSRFAKLLGNRDTIYGLGKSLGVKFKPWGAVKAAGRAAKVAPVLAAVGFAVDAYGVVADERASRDRDMKREEAEDFITHIADALVDKVLDGPEHDGPLPMLDDSCRALEEYKDAVTERMTQSAREVAAVQTSIDKIDHVLRAAGDTRSGIRGTE